MALREKLRVQVGVVCIFLFQNPFVLILTIFRVFWF